MHPRLQSGLKTRVYWMTKRIAQGQFVTRERASVLRDQSVTHVLNVGDVPSIVTAPADGFQSVVDIAIEDLHCIASQQVIDALNHLHQMMMVPDSRAFVHCVAGQNRSPTILWLYLIACGLAPDDARMLIADRNPDAVPGQGNLVDASLVRLAQSHGHSHFLPLTDATITQAAYELCD